MESQLEELLEYCQTEAGESLQSIFTYSEASAEPYYVREDMQEAFRSGGFQRFQEAAWAIHETVLEEASKADVLGEYRTTVHTFDTAFVMQFITRKEIGVVVSFDQDIGRNLHRFLLECEHYL